MKKILLIALGLAAPGAAVADEWSGGYAGVALGLGSGKVVPIAPLALETDGMIGGAFGGFRTDLGQVVLGAEFDFNLAAIDADLTTVRGILGTPTGDDIAFDSVHRLKFRAGYDAGRALVYGVGGLARGTFDLGLGGVSRDYTDTGAVYGAGTEIQLAPNLSAGAEVLFHDFGNVETFTLGGTAREVDASLTTVQARIAVTF